MSGTEGRGANAAGPSIGPTLPPHLAAQLTSSERGPVIGPSLPPNLQVSEAESVALPQQRRPIGPSRPSLQDEEEPKLNAATQAFLDRERRMKEASDRQAAGLDAGGSSSNNRPEWMLALPTAQSFSESIQKDQSAALKNRGFSQAQNARVQRGKGGAGLGGTGEQNSSLWTETPQEREKRLLEEEMGIRPKGEAAGQAEGEEEAAKRMADREREERVQEAIRKHDASRGPSLMEQHQAKRRGEMRDKGKGRDKELDSRSRRRDESDSEESSERRRRRHRRHRDESDRRHDRKQDGERRSSHRRRHDSASESESASGRDRERSSKRHKSRKGEEKEHRRSGSKDRDRERQKREKEREKEKRARRGEREREEKGEKKGAPMMVWDREAAMSVGGKLMDDQKRMDTIRSAASLGSRFGGGSSRFL